MTGDGRECCANDDIVHEQQRLVVALFRLGVFILMAAAVFEVMFHEVRVTLHSVDNWPPSSSPISRDVEDGPHEIFDVNKHTVILQVVGWVSIVHQAGGGPRRRVGR